MGDYPPIDVYCHLGSHCRGPASSTDLLGTKEVTTFVPDCSLYEAPQLYFAMFFRSLKLNSEPLTNIWFLKVVRHLEVAEHGGKPITASLE